MLGCGRLTTKLGSGSSVGYIWCIRLSPLAWYLAQSVARLYTCLLPHRCVVFSSCFNSSLFSKVQWQWSCPYANAKTPALHYRCSFLSLSLPPAARRTHVAKTGAALCLTSRPSEQTRRIAFCGCRAAKVDQNKIQPPRGGHTQALVTRSAEEFPPRFDAH